MSEKTLKMIKDNDVKWVDLRFTDPRGKEQHTTFPANVVTKDTIEEGFMFDGSSIAGWKAINESDMILLPDDDTPVIDPFRDETTLNLRCDIIEPGTMQPYDATRVRSRKAAEAYLKSSGIGDTAYFGPEAEFFIFDDVRWKVQMSGASYSIAFGGSCLGIQRRIRERQHGSPSAHQGRLLPGSAGRFGGRYP